MKQRCPTCGTELSESSPAGLCPSCLMSEGMATLETTAQDVAAQPPISPELRADLEDDRFGPYRLLRQIGEGGMGAVYLAEQLRPIKRQVALKVVKLGMDTRLVVSRFESERQALALMDHPNIAHVYEAGTSEKGRPYFIMEYVEGVPITQFCDQHCLNTRDRLDLFAQVCAALQHAHQKGIIHRDVKPSNILVGEQDGKPFPKVIDFGIAKATDHLLAEHTAFTETGYFAGTPEYMSPEQADLKLQDVDTRSDVYSLGIVLYELLVGAVPFDGASLRRAGLAELLRVIREQEVPTPSAKLTTMHRRDADTAGEIARRRGTDHPGLRRQLASDLNWIVMKALEKDRQRRYASVSELAADIRRHLADQPVLATPPSALYLTQKFVRRNKAAVAAALLVAASLIVGLAATLWQAHVAEVRRQEAQAQRQEAETQRNRAEQNEREAISQRNEALAQRKEADTQRTEAEVERRHAEELFGSARQFANAMMFDVNDQIAELEGGTAARESLVNKSIAYLDHLAKDPGSDAKSRKELAAAYIKVGDLQGRPEYASLNDREGAAASERKAVALLEPLLRANPRDPELRHLLIVALARRSYVQAYLPGYRDGMQADTQRCLELAERFAADEPANWQAKRDLALALSVNSVAERDRAMVLKTVRRAVQIMDSVVTAGPNTPQDRFERAHYEWRAGITSNGEDALQWYAKSVGELEALSRDFPTNAQYRRQLAIALGNQANLLQLMNRDNDAIASASRAVSLQERLASADPKNTAFRLDGISLQQTLGNMQHRAGKRDEAMETFRKALANADKLVAEQPDNPEFHLWHASCNMSLAGLVQADPAARISYERKAEAEVAELARQFPDRPLYRYNLVSYRISLAHAIEISGDPAGGIALKRQAVAAGEELLGLAAATDDDRNEVGYAHYQLSVSLGNAGRVQEAIDEVQKSIVLRETLVARHPGKVYAVAMADQYALVAHYYTLSRDWKNVLEYGAKAMRSLDQLNVVGSDSGGQSTLVYTLGSIGLAYEGLNDHPHAVETSRRVAEIRERYAALEADSIGRAELYTFALLDLATKMRDAGDRQGALDSYRRARTALDKFDPAKLGTFAQRQELANGYRSLSGSLAVMDEDAGALATARIAAQLYEALYAADPKSTSTMSGLRYARRALASALARSGDSAGSIAEYRTALDLELDSAASHSSSAQLETAASIQRDIAGLEALLGDPGSAERDFRKAIELSTQAYARAEKTWNADHKTFASLDSMIGAEEKIADILERLGKREEAAGYSLKAMEHAKLRLEADPKNYTAIHTLQEATHTVDRIEWERAGEKGHYSLSIVDSKWSVTGVATLEARSLADVRASVAWFYNRLGARLDNDGDLARTRRAGLKQLEMFEVLFREDPQYVVNATHGMELALNHLAEASMLMARRTSGDERLRNLQEARDYLVRANTLMKGAEAKHQVDETLANEPGKIAVKLATVEAWLREPSLPKVLAADGH